MGAFGSRRKNVYVLKGVRAFSDEELCVFLERGARLASGAEWEPSGAATKTYMFWDGYAAKQARYGEILRWLKITRSACLWSMRTCFFYFPPIGACANCATAFKRNGHESMMCEICFKQLL